MYLICVRDDTRQIDECNVYEIWAAHLQSDNIPRKIDGMFSGSLIIVLKEFVDRKLFHKWQMQNSSLRKQKSFFNPLRIVQRFTEWNNVRFRKQNAFNIIHDSQWDLTRPAVAVAVGKNNFHRTTSTSPNLTRNTDLQMRKFKRRNILHSWPRSTNFCLLTGFRWRRF